MASSRHSSDEGSRRPLLSRTSTAYDSDTTLHSAINQPQISTPRGIAIAFAIWVLIFVLTCNISLITTTQSSIAQDLRASTEVSWFTSAYLIAITSLTPISGKLCQIFTPRVYLLVSILIQAIGLLITSQAQNLHVFLTGRAVCGIGSAAVTPVAFILVTEFTSLKRRAIFFGLINTGYTTGVACGAIIAGALEPVVGWRAVFWLQIPFSLTAAVVAFWAIPKHEPVSSELEDVKFSRKFARIDYFGILSLILALVMLLYTLSAKSLEPVPLTLSLAMLMLFVFVEVKWAVEPIVPPEVLRSKANILSGIATVGLMSARWGILFYTPVYAIAVRGWKPSAAGALLVPTNAGFGLGGIVAGWLHIKKARSYYVPTLTSFALFAVVQFVVSRLTSPDTALWVFVVALFVNGFITGALLNYSLAHLLYLTLPSQHVLVIPFNATFRSFSGSFGSAISGGYFLRTLYNNLETGFSDAGIKHHSKLVRSLLGSPILVQQLLGIEKEVARNSYNESLRSMFTAGVGLALLMLVVQAGTGWTAPSKPSGPDEAQTRTDDIARIPSHD